jgi:hypothetical protein
MQVSSAALHCRLCYLCVLHVGQILSSRHVLTLQLCVAPALCTGHGHDHGFHGHGHGGHGMGGMHGGGGMGGMDPNVLFQMFMQQQAGRR